MTHEELIAALEQATGPIRELDAGIFRAVGLSEIQERHCKDWCRMDRRTDLTRDHYIRAWASDYTSSLDAALTLVPDGWDWTLYSDGSGEIYKDVASGMLPGAPGSTVIDFDGPTPAIALCIAALKARSTK